ncbi:hypothetical protein ABMC89_03295 [Sulfitobacter sp. HNIBRBA3233]|uniref:hypothetical protein n=1 Tax=Sulfitobacter marinivivus TaxID=3158558 RepID=UPI0032DFA711
MLGKLFKLLVILAILGFIALVAYAYAAPYFGVSFSQPPAEIRVPVTLEGQ